MGRATVHAGFLHGSKRRLGNVKLLEKFRERIHIQPGWQTKQLLPTMQIDLFGGGRKKTAKIVSMLLLFDIYLCLVLSLTLTRHRIVFYVTAMGVNLSPLLIIFFNQHVSHPILSLLLPLHNSAYEH